MLCGCPCCWFARFLHFLCHYRCRYHYDYNHLPLLLLPPPLPPLRSLDLPPHSCAAKTVPQSKPLLRRAEVQEVLQMSNLLIVFLPGAGCLYRPGLECLLACGLQSGKLHGDYLQSLARKCPVKSKCSAQKYIMGWAYPAWPQDGFVVHSNLTKGSSSMRVPR